MLGNIINYFNNLNSAGQILFVVGILLVITFIILMVVVLKPDRNKVKKIYGESPITDRENDFEEKMKDIDNIGIDDINIDNDKTRNLKNIVDELKQLETKPSKTPMEIIEEYEDEQEDTAIISIEELLKSNKPVTYERRSTPKPVEKKVEKKKEDFVFIEDVTKEMKTITKEDERKYTPTREVFSSVYAPKQDKKEDNNEFLSSLKKFRNNL